MWGLLRPRTNEGVSRLKRSTWYEWTLGEFWTGQTIWRVVAFLLFFIHVSFLHFFFILKKTQLQQQANKEQRNTTKKNIQKCGGQIAFNSIWLCPSNKTKFFLFFSPFFFFLLPLQLKGGNLLVPSNICLLIIIFFFSSVSEEQKSLLFVFNMDIQILNRYVFRRNLLLMNNLKMFLWNSLDTDPLFRWRILFIIKFLTNLFFSFLSFVNFFFLIFVNLLITSFCFSFLLRWASVSYPTESTASIRPFCD